MIRKVIIKYQTHERLRQLAIKYSNRILCGLLIGEKNDNQIIIEDFYVLPTRSGHKIHFKPNWKAYREGFRYIRQNLMKNVVGEFHTHPDGMEELNINDRRILKKLGRGFWVIVTPKKIIPWFYIRSNDEENFQRIDVQIIE